MISNRNHKTEGGDRMRRIAAVTIICVLACLTIANAHESHNRILAEELLGAMEVQELAKEMEEQEAKVVE